MKKILLAIAALIAISTTAQAEEYLKAPVYKEVTLTTANCADMHSSDGWREFAHPAQRVSSHYEYLKDGPVLTWKHSVAMDIERSMNYSYYVLYKEDLFAVCDSIISHNVKLFKKSDVLATFEHNEIINSKQRADYENKQKLDFSKLK